MKIDWKARISNKSFWLTLIPAVIILIQVIASLFGIDLNLSDLSAKLLDVVNALFIVLGIIGIVNNPTTPGITDKKDE